MGLYVQEILDSLHKRQMLCTTFDLWQGPKFSMNFQWQIQGQMICLSSEKQICVDCISNPPKPSPPCSPDKPLLMQATERGCPCKEILGISVMATMFTAPVEREMRGGSSALRQAAAQVPLQERHVLMRPRCRESCPLPWQMRWDFKKKRGED